MRVFYWPVAVVAVAVLLNACTVGETPPTAQSSPSPAATSPPAVTASPATSSSPNVFNAKPAVKVAPNSKQPLFKTAFVASTSAVVGLINTTDKGQRQDLLSKKFNVTTNRKRDPFGAIPGTLPPVPASPTPAKLPPASRVVVGKPQKPVFVQPDPAEAKSISVTGVMDMAGTQYAIVNVPGEPTSRYVKVGQRLVNNQVLVKRIEMLGTPTVVFQQFNVEVPRPVGLVATAPDAAKNSGLPAPAPNTSVTPPTGVILPPAPTISPTVVPQNTVNTPTIVAPAGVPVPNSIVVPQ
jgi:hypothetical protein